MNSRTVSQQNFQSRPLPMLPIVIAQQTVLLPLYFFVPLWITLLNVICGLIIVGTTYNQKLKVGRWLKIAITLIAIGGILFTFKKFSGRDAGVALICVMYGLKILETHKTRDANLLLSMGFFMLVAGFLFTQKPWIAFYQFIPILAILNALVAMHSLEQSKSNRLSIGKVLRDFSKYLMLALPIMVILFVFFPRFSGPIWRMPGAASAASGISDNMSPGAISSLQLFDKVAFRVQFAADEPQVNKMYWRAMVLDQFDGFTWTQGGSKPISDPGTALTTKASFQYTVTLEQTRQNYLVTLDRPVQTPQQGKLLQDFTTYTPFRILDRIRYTATSSPDYLIEPILTQNNKKNFLNLPDSGNARARTWAQKQRELFASDWEFINHLLTQINRMEYFYTLAPPIMDEDTVDSFWFDHQKGFCEHYAGALVYMARAANIPARVVIGYQGGEKNPLSDYWIVRYANAHAWTEIWIEGRGWVRVDPTSAIASHRIEEQLLSDYHQRDSLFDEFDFVALDDIGLFKQFEYWADQFNNRWNDWILDYNNQVQRQLFRNWGLSGMTSRQMVIAMIVLVAFFVLFSSFKWFHQRVRLEPVARAFVLLQKRLDQKNIVQFDPALGPQALRIRLTELGEVKYQPLLQLLDEYIQLRYQSEKPEQQRLKSLVRNLKYLTLP